MYVKLNENESFQFQKDGFNFKIDNGEPSDFAKKIAREELRETPENIENGLKQLRDLLKEEPNLNCPLDNDLWLLSFLRPAHFYPEGAMEMIRIYFNIRKKYFSDLTLECVREYMQGFNGSLLPQRDQYGRRIYVALVGKYWDHHTFHKDLLLKVMIPQMELIRTEPDTQICGFVVILDLCGFSLRQSLYITLGYLKFMSDYLQEGICIRFKAYHVVNQPKVFELLFSMVKPMLKEKFRKEYTFMAQT